MPTRLRILIALNIGLLAASLLILPSWPGKWLANTSQHGNFVPALVLPFGPLLLLAVLRCRCPRGRLLLTMSAVPQRFYDPLLLWLIPRTPWQSLPLSVLGWAAYRFLLSSGLWGSLTPAMAQAAVLVMYYPALATLFSGNSPPAFRPWACRSGSLDDETAIQRGHTP